MKGQIYQLLKNGKMVSGEMLSRELGISRVSVWKHIRGLKDLGYDIIAGPKGYQLKGSLDALYPWELPGWESKIHYYPEVDSTMDIARDMAIKGCPDFTVMVAGVQKKGRGRLRRKWYSEEGGLFFTMVLRPGIPMALSPRINFLASMTLVKTLKHLFKIDANVKWPNDILVNEKKISGMLSEIDAETDLIHYINIGMGVNVNNDPALNEPTAVSLMNILGKPVMRKKILWEFLNRFEAGMKKQEWEKVINDWKKHTITLNRHVKIATAHEKTEGIARDVDDSGALILELTDGSMKKIIYGDCFHIR